MSPNITPFVVFLAVYAVGVLSQNDRGGCYIQGVYYAHSRVFTLPGQSRCLRHICWYGDLILREEGCEVNDQCHRVSSTFEHNCVRYYCNKTNIGPNSYFYRSEIISSRCRDANNRCRRPGEYFPFNMNGRYYPRCTCTTVSPERINYRCVTTTAPRYVPVGNPQSGGRQGQGQGYYPDPRSGRIQGNNQVPRDLSGGGQMGGRRSRYESRNYYRQTEHNGY